MPSGKNIEEEDTSGPAQGAAAKALALGLRVTPSLPLALGTVSPSNRPMSPGGDQRALRGQQRSPPQLESVKEEKPSSPTAEDEMSKWILAAMLFLEVLAHLDSGIVPAVVAPIQQSFDPPISNGAIGVVGGLGYIGVLVAAPVSGWMLSNIKKTKRVMFVAIVVEIFALVFFATGRDVWHLWASRFIVGAGQGFLMNYIPVWVDQNAPPKSMTTYMAILQAFCLLGVVVGYIAAAAIVDFTGDIQSWRYALYGQALLFVPYALFFCKAPSRLLSLKIEVRRKSQSVVPGELGPVDESDFAEGPEDGEENGSESMWTMLCRLSECPVYMWLVGAMCCMYWGLTGIQFWITKYLIEVIGMSAGTAAVSFSIVSVAGPVVGLVFGGWVVDRAGGYKATDEFWVELNSDPQQAKALWLLTLMGGACSIPAVMAAVVDEAVLVIIFVSAILFGGGAVVPAATGIAMSCVPLDLKPFANSFYLFMTHVFGYAAAPIVMGALAQSIGGTEGEPGSTKESRDRGLRVGFFINQCMGPLAVIFVFVAYRKAAAAVKLSETRRDTPQKTTVKVLSPIKGNGAETKLPTAHSPTPVARARARTDDAAADLTAAGAVVPAVKSAVQAAIPDGAAPEFGLKPAASPPRQESKMEGKVAVPVTGRTSPDGRREANL